ncbi:hypothetical protein [Kitasatospora sp. NPDC127060]|uniref:hypothetical protein n=1 Tax=Kitasatospora sp. NPDC127060 TaxID=3347121 RepID=UPI003652FC83
MKGGALLLGAEHPGRPGPFGTWTDHPDSEPDGPGTEDTDGAPSGTADRGRAR